MHTAAATNAVMHHTLPMNADMNTRTPVVAAIFPAGPDIFAMLSHDTAWAGVSGSCRAPKADDPGVLDGLMVMPGRVSLNYI